MNQKLYNEIKEDLRREHATAEPLSVNKMKLEQEFESFMKKGVDRGYDTYELSKHKGLSR